MSVVPDADSYVRGYVYEVDGVRVPLERVEVIHFKRWHPRNDYYGLSALQAAAVAVHTDRAMATWNRNTFGQDNGVPAGIVTLPETTSKTDFERIQREWRNSYGGSQRRTAFMRAGGVTWQGISSSHTDLDFLRGRTANRDEILNIFGLPVGLVSENATEANATVAERSFIERTLYPKLVRLAATLTAELVPFYETSAVVEFEDIRPTDVQARLDEIRTAGAVLSVNEIRARYYDLPPVGWGEVPPGAVTTDPVPPPAEDTQPDPPSEKALTEELRQWESYTLKRLGQPAPRPFEVKHLPETVAFEVSARLLGAGDDADAVKAVFAEVRAGLTADDAP
jgi:HK97 family phage portal protein